MRIRLEIEDFAKIKKASFLLNDLVVFVGDNNSGKTLAMELIYGVISKFIDWEADCIGADIIENDDFVYIYFKEMWYKNVEKNVNDFFEENKEEFVKQCFSKYIPIGKIKVCFEDEETTSYVATVDIEGKKANLEKSYKIQREIRSDVIVESLEGNNLESIKSQLSHTILMDMIGIKPEEHQIFIPASRAGLQMFYKYYFAVKEERAGVTKSIYDYVHFLQTYSTKTEYTNEENCILEFLEKNLLNGKVKYDDNEFMYEEDGNIIPLSLASSMIHELATFSNILKSSNKYGYIYYDEIENSVHPLLQGDVAKLVIRTVNAGKKIVLSTHSDTMAGKINNLILVSKIKNVVKRNKIASDMKYAALDLLAADKSISVYEFRKNIAGRVTVDELEFMNYPRIGYAFGRFNENIDQLYDESNCIMKYDENTEA